MRALVTGGSSGLGAALAAALRARGDSVLVADLSAEPSDAPGREQVRLDVRSQDDWDATRDWVAEHWGGLDLLVNNAGIAGGGRIDLAGIEEWQAITDVNLFGVVRGVQTYVSMLKAQRSGTILNVASLAGLVHPAGMASYNAVKAGVVALTETLGHELAGYGIRTAVLCPSYFKTNLMASLEGADTALVDIVRGLVERSPYTADDIAAAALAGLEAGEEVILPDEAARQAWRLKQGDRAAYDQVMRRQAARLSQAAGEESSDE